MKMVELFSFAVIAVCCTGVSAMPSTGTSAVAGCESNVALSEKDVANINDSMKVSKRRRAASAKNLVQKDINDYFSERGITPGQSDESGTVYFSEIALVERNVKDPNFIKSRALAFDKACQNALAKYAMDKFGHDMMESTVSDFDDQSSNRLEPTVGVKDAVSRISEKVEQLTEAQLDRKLQELGKTPAGAIVEKRKLLEKSIVKKSMARALGSTSGVLPVQSFEGWTENGKYAVGVVLRGGVTTEEVANCLRRKRRPGLVRPTGMSLKDAIPGEDELVRQFGVRLFFDETGTPALLSFGQWGVSYTGTDEDMLDRAEESAGKQAERAANEALTQFINSTISVSEMSEQGEEDSVSALFDNEGNLSEKHVMEIIDRMNSRSVLRGHDTMIGRSTPVPPVILEHPSGHAVAVCVRMWSFKQYDAMKKGVDGNVRSPSDGLSAPRELGESGRGTRRGRSYDF